MGAEQNWDWHARRDLTFCFAVDLGGDVREALWSDYGLGPGENTLTIRAVALRFGALKVPFKTCPGER